MPQSSGAVPSRFLLIGAVTALLLGVVLGYLRYWIGFFVLAQGVCIGLLAPWLAVQFFGGKSPEHPGAKGGAGLAFLWFLAANFGLMMGFGLAQPWFDPLGWLGRILSDNSQEFVFGVASTAGFSRGVALGAHGWFWLVLSAIDWAIMFFFLWIMPFSQKGKKIPPKSKVEAAS